MSSIPIIAATRTRSCRRPKLARNTGRTWPTWWPPEPHMPTPIRQSLAALVGEDRITSVGASPTLVRARGGTLPSLAIAPTSAEQVAELLRFAAERGLAALVYGTELVCGAPPQKADFFLDLRALDSVLEVEPGD